MAKEKKKKGILVDHHRGKNVALIFEKDSTRTRSSFEIAAHDLGMGTTYIGTMGSQFGKKESIKDTARVLAGMYEGIEYRGFGQEIVEELAKYSKVPVWNGLTNEYHPTQMLADMLTIQEEFGHLKGIKLVYMGDARYNMGNSLMIASAKMGMDFVACAPKKYFPNAELVAQCEEYAKESGATITLTEDVKEGTKDADVIYTDVWVSMGEPDSVWEERIHDLTPYRVTKEAMANAKDTAVFLHCLPSFHDLKTKIGKEIHDRYGLDEIDNKILCTIIDKFKGGPVGLTTIATALGEDPGTLEEVYEPFLIKEGFLKRTPRGREVTELAYKHLGRSIYNNVKTLFDD